MSTKLSKREVILDIAQESILAKGFGGTSIEEIVAEAQITKSGFFYHFKDKNELARALLQRYLDTEDAILDDIFNRAKDLHDDPLHAMLIGIKLLAELMADLPNGHPGCLVVTVTHAERLFDQPTRDLNRQGVLSWRRRFHTMLEAIAERHPPKEDIDLEVLADMICTTIEGGIVMSRAVREPKVLPDQLLLLRSYLKLLFQQ